MSLKRVFYSVLSGCMLLCTSVSAQDVSISREVFSTGGETSEMQLGEQRVYWAWSMGEPLVETYSASKKKWTQGFLQGDGFVKDTIGLDTTNIVGNESLVLSQIEVYFYPNPTKGQIFLEMSALSEMTCFVQIELLDFTGKAHKSIGYSKLPLKEELDITSSPAGFYLLSLRFKGNEKGKETYSKVYKIIKK